MSSSSLIASFAAREWLRTKPRLRASVVRQNAEAPTPEGGQRSPGCPAGGLNRAAANDARHDSPPQQTRGPENADRTSGNLASGRGEKVQPQDRLPLTRNQLHQKIEAQDRALKLALARNEALEKQVCCHQICRLRHFLCG